MSALLFLLSSHLLFAGQSRLPIKWEAEDAELMGPTISKTRTGYSGSGYITGFTKEGDAATLRTKATGGIYEVKIRYCAPGGPKGFGLRVNGSEISGMFPATGDKFNTIIAGKIELKSGSNIIEIEKGWGYFDVDFIELVPTQIQQDLCKVPQALVDSQSTQATKNLFKRLSASYGQRTLSGQYDINDTSYIEQTAGVTPAIFGSDFMDYSPSRVEHGSNTKDITERAIKRAKLGQIITMSWHWNAPTDLIDKKIKDAAGKEIDASWYKGFYTNATTFDLAQALADPKTERYKLLIRDIDAIAIQLKKFSDAGVPVLWRPLHEAEGGWFWWGAKGPQPFVQLWHILYDRLTKHHQLHNLIWVFTVGSNPAWYPGDNYVDVLGVDAYPSDHSDPLSGIWEDLKRQFNGKKLLSLTEFGGVPDAPKMHRFGVDWSYFVSWPGQVKAPSTSVSTLKRIYQDKSVINKR